MAVQEHWIFAAMAAQTSWEGRDEWLLLAAWPAICPVLGLAKVIYPKKEHNCPCLGFYNPLRKPS